MTKPFKFSGNLMVFLCCTLLLLLPGHVLGQTAAVPVRDPNAVALASRALQGLVGVTTLTDITLEASATYIAGSDREMGPATLVALGNQRSRVTLNLTSGQRQEIRRGPAGAWVGADGTPHAVGRTNCHVDAPWFYPALTLSALASDPTLAISLVGQEVHVGEPVYHLVVYHQAPSQNPKMAAIVREISAMHIYLDTNTLRPLALVFNLHPDRDVAINIPVEIRFGEYQSFNGMWVPTRIQRFLQYSLVLDLTVASAAVNSGVPASAFTLPVASAGGLK